MRIDSIFIMEENDIDESLNDTTEALNEIEEALDIEGAIDSDLWRLMIIFCVLLLIFYSISGHFIDKFKILFIHESTVGVLTGMLV